MGSIADISFDNYSNRIRLLGGFLENLYQYWWDDYTSVADYVDFYIDGFSAADISEMRNEFVSLDLDGASGADLRTFLRRMNVNYRLEPGVDGGRVLLNQVGMRLAQLADGAEPKHFD